jgi:DNA-binding NtrC family response regulator
LNARHECRVAGLHPETFEILSRHDWPGNVRELRNVLEYAVILAGEGEALPSHLPRSGGLPVRHSAPPAAAADGVLLPVGTTLERAERELIELTLRHTANNKTRAATILGVSPKTLFNKLREYGAADAGE